MTRSCLALAFSVLAAAVATAQPLGSFRWQLEPYCNAVTLDVEQRGGIFRLSGFDDGCGVERAPVTGTATLAGDGSVLVGLTIVETPGAVPRHLSGRLSPSTLSGTWLDSAGLGGPFRFAPADPASGAPRPVGGLGAAAVDTTQIQRRVSGVCPSGQAMRAVNVDGAVECAITDGTSTIARVTAGPGLTGGGSTGDVTLAVLFGSSGTSDIAARADHRHAVGGTANTAIGENALARQTGTSNTAVGYRSLFGNTSGTLNTAVGSSSLAGNSTGSHNVAIGTGALSSNESGDRNIAIGFSLSGNTSGESNVGVGFGTLAGNTTGANNVAMGTWSLSQNSTGKGNVGVGFNSLTANVIGSNNTALGPGSLAGVTTGSQNIAIGVNAGGNLTAGVNNIHIGHPGGSAGESDVIRIGTTGQTRAFVAGIRGVQTANNNAVAVVIDSAGQLGTLSSTRHSKEAIADLGDLGAALQRLRPVQFQYREPFADGSKPLQFGLIAEEVEAVIPALVAYDEAGQPVTVKYHVLPTLLVAEIQRLERQRRSLEGAIRTLQDEVAALQRQMRSERR